MFSPCAGIILEKNYLSKPETGKVKFSFSDFSKVKHLKLRKMTLNESVSRCSFNVFLHRTKAYTMLVVVQKLVCGFLYKIFWIFISTLMVWLFTERFTTKEFSHEPGRESNQGPALRKASTLITFLRHTPNIRFRKGGHLYNMRAKFQ
jgi:hypothetical protein